VGNVLAGGHEIAFVHQLVEDAARQLGGHVDLGRLDAPVTAGETGVAGQVEGTAIRGKRVRPLRRQPRARAIFGRS
jgi:hypothetical protein